MTLRGTCVLPMLKVGVWRNRQTSKTEEKIWNPPRLVEDAHSIFYCGEEKACINDKNDTCFWCVQSSFFFETLTLCTLSLKNNLYTDIDLPTLSLFSVWRNKEDQACGRSRE